MERTNTKDSLFIKSILKQAESKVTIPIHKHLMNINGTKSWTTKDFKQANDVRVLQGIVKFTTGKR